MADTVATASGAGRDSRSNLLSLLQTASGLFGTGKQTTSETVSQGKNLTPQQIQALMNSMMSSSQGLASVLLPQRQAGLYNSNVNNLLAQQMATQVAAKAAELGTPTTTTSTKSVQTGASPMAMPLAGLLGGLQAVSLAKSAAASETGKKVLGAFKGTSAASAADPLAELLDAGSSQLLVDNAAFGTQMADWASTVNPDVLTGFGTDAGSLAFSDIGSLASSASVPYMAIGNVASNALESVLGNNVFSNAWQGVMEPVNEVVGGVTSAVEDAFKGIGDVLGFGGGGGGCFITTACMQKHKENFDDDCRELTAMRKLRDDYAHTLPEGPALVNQYYRFAPSYVFWLNARDDADEVWAQIYSEYILPAVEAVEKEHMHKAYEIYVSLVEYVKEKVMEES